MADFDAELVTSAGLDATANPANAGGDTVPPDVIVRVANASGAAVTVTVPTPGTVDGLAITDRQVPVPDGEARYVRLPRAVYRNPGSGRVNLQYAPAAAGVTVEVIR